MSQLWVKRTLQISENQLVSDLKCPQSRDNTLISRIAFTEAERQLKKLKKIAKKLKKLKT